MTVKGTAEAVLAWSSPIAPTLSLAASIASSRRVRSAFLTRLSGRLRQGSLLWWHRGHSLLEWHEMSCGNLETWIKREVKAFISRVPALPRYTQARTEGSKGKGQLELLEIRRTAEVNSAVAQWEIRGGYSTRGLGCGVVSLPYIDWCRLSRAGQWDGKHHEGLNWVLQMPKESPREPKAETGPGRLPWTR